MPGHYKKHTVTQPIMPEMRLEPLNICLTKRHLNQLKQRDSEEVNIDMVHLITVFIPVHGV